jgi:hypothetical protein
MVGPVNETVGDGGWDAVSAGITEATVTGGDGGGADGVTVVLDSPAVVEVTSAGGA